MAAADHSIAARIAAIDFGATFCSLCYQVPGYERKILEISGIGILSISTALLVKITGSSVEVVSIGSKAQSMYRRIPSKKHKQYVYFESFKIQLRDECVS